VVCRLGGRWQFRRAVSPGSAGRSGSVTFSSSSVPLPPHFLTTVCGFGDVLRRTATAGCSSLVHAAGSWPVLGGHRLRRPPCYCSRTNPCPLLQVCGRLRNGFPPTRALPVFPVSVPPPPVNSVAFVATFFAVLRAWQPFRTCGLLPALRAHADEPPATRPYSPQRRLALNWLRGTGGVAGRTPLPPLPSSILGLRFFCRHYWN